MIRTPSKFLRDLSKFKRFKYLESETFSFSLMNKERLYKNEEGARQKWMHSDEKGVQRLMRSADFRTMFFILEVLAKFHKNKFEDSI